MPGRTASRVKTMVKTRNDFVLAGLAVGPAGLSKVMVPKIFQCICVRKLAWTVFVVR